MAPEEVVQRDREASSAHACSTQTRCEAAVGVQVRAAITVTPGHGGSHAQGAVAVSLRVRESVEIPVEAEGVVHRCHGRPKQRICARRRQHPACGLDPGCKPVRNGRERVARTPSTPAPPTVGPSRAAPPEQGLIGVAAGPQATRPAHTSRCRQSLVATLPRWSNSPATDPFRGTHQPGGAVTSSSRRNSRGVSRTRSDSQVRSGGESEYALAKGMSPLSQGRDQGSVCASGGAFARYRTTPSTGLPPQTCGRDPPAPTMRSAQRKQSAGLGGNEALLHRGDNPSRTRSRSHP